MSEFIQSTLISALPAATKVSDTDIVVLENGSTTQKITIAQLKEALGINALNTKIIQKQYTITGTGISYYYIAPPQDNMKCISVSNANWSSCNVIVKGISMSGASAIIFTERNISSSEKLTINSFWMES